MKRRGLFVTLLTGAALAGAHAQAGGTQNDMPRQNTNTQREEHVIASPNPTIDDSKATAIDPGQVTATRVEPSTTATAAPLKTKTRPRRTQKSRQ